MKTDDPLVVRFHIQDREKFKPIADAIFESMRHQSRYHGGVVIAISLEDVFTQLEAFEHGDED